MKRLLFIVTAILVFVEVSGDSWKTSNRLAGTEDLFVIDSKSDNLNNTIVFGYFNGSINPSTGDAVDSYGARDYFIAKFDSLSNVLWVKAIGSGLNEFPEGGLCIGPDESIYVTGGFQSYLKYTETDSIQSTGIHDIFVAKYNTDGDNVWCRNMGQGASFQISTLLEIDNNSDLLLGGYFVNDIDFDGAFSLTTNNAYKDYFLAKLSSTDGSFVWAKQFESLNNNLSGFLYAASVTDNSYYVTGVFSDSVRIEEDTIVGFNTSKYDTHIIKTNTSGDVIWKRLIQGNDQDYTYTSTLDPDENLYITGYTSSPEITVDSTDLETSVYTKPGGGWDIFIAKYNSEGTLQWFKMNGGPYEDRLLDSEFYDSTLHVTGYFAGNMTWGPNLLSTLGSSDRDAFKGEIDPDGNFLNATSFGGRTTNSKEEGYSVFNSATNVYQLMRSNAAILEIGDSIYTSTTGKMYLVVGIVGCVPIIIEDVTTTDISTCAGDSTGSIVISASGGLGGTWKYSIGGEYEPQTSQLFQNLPAGVYQISVADGTGCAKKGPAVTISEPEPLSISITDTVDITIDENGKVEVEATGGTPPYLFTLQPTGTQQILGMFEFAWGDSGKYVVEVSDSKGCGPFATDTFEINQIFGCKEITFDNIVSEDVLTCFGDSNGWISIEVSGGWGGPWEYSIDGGETFQADSVFNDLPAGDYTIMVMDMEDCPETGSEVVTIGQPDSMYIDFTFRDTITPDANAFIEVSVTGGTSPYTFTLQPNGTEQSLGMFEFSY